MRSADSASIDAPHGIYLEEQAGPEVADRFLAAVQGSFEILAAMPRMGARCGFRRPVARRLRRWAVKGFENGLIFYKPQAERGRSR